VVKWFRRHRPGAPFESRYFSASITSSIIRLVGFAGCFAEGRRCPWFSSTMPTVSFVSPGAELFGAKLCEIESGYEVGNHHAALAVDLADAFFSPSLVFVTESTRVGVRVGRRTFCGIQP